MLLLPFVLFNVLTTLYAQHINNTGGDDLSSRILYGERANIKDYPFFAILSHCGAAILSEWWLATAAHCVKGNILHDVGRNVWVGEDSLPTSSRYIFNEVYIHPHYGVYFETFSINDIALLKLTTPLKFRHNVKPIKLPKQQYEINATYAFAGMGLDETGKRSSHLMTMNVRALGRNEWFPSMPLPWLQRRIVYPYLDLIEGLIIFTKRTEDSPGACFGDSGSPLVQGNTLVGLASYISDSDCAKASFNVFTNVAPFVDWIKWVTGIQ